MSQIRVLNQKTIAEVMEMDRVIEVVKAAYVTKSRGQAVLWPLIFHEFEPETAEMDIKSGTMENQGIYGLKVVSWYEKNAKAGLPQLFGTVLVFDSATGAPLGLLDAAYLTGLRTGAAGAIGAAALARPEAENLLIVGAGHQAVFQVAATLTAMDNIKTVQVYDGLDAENARRLSGRLKDTLTEDFLSRYAPGSAARSAFEKKLDVRYEAVEDIEAATRASDIIITITPSRQPIIQADWVRPGTHLSCIGSDTSGKQEVDERLMAGARIFVDDVAQASAVGEIETALKRGLIGQGDIAGEIGEVLAGEKPGRRSPQDITVFDSTGIALQDIAAAKLAIDLAEEKGLGVTVEL
ncbi:ornithine cyclodeaminase family protein [Ruminococcaceae bacterium OttesenSCG-928-A11]|nr:ornithine cyclodeaminase family protein [Ruminococcaceae bacterium OttesenSCG-928-A11]